MGPLEFIYYLGYSFNKSRSLKNQKKLPHRVISVGNLTVGGTGKTPAVIALAEEAKKRGYQPCILTRGYRGKAKGVCFISKGEGPLLTVDEAGDEALLMAERLKGVPVVKGSDRYEAGLFAIRELESLVSGLRSQFFFILDDGFQHLGLYRDTDILLIDSTIPMAGYRLLPIGRLREPLSEMKRADIIVLTKVRNESEETSPAFAALTREVRSYNSDAPVYGATHMPVGLKVLSGGDLPLDVLAGTAVLAFCGIGSPSSFRETLLKMKADVRQFVAFKDHHAYHKGDLERILGMARECRADWIVTTEKDIMRLKGFEDAGKLVALSIAFRAEESFYDAVLAEG